MGQGREILKDDLWGEDSMQASLTRSQPRTGCRTVNKQDWALAEGSLDATA